MAFSVKSNLAKTLLALDTKTSVTPKTRVAEAWTMRAREMGETPFKKSTLQDRHIQEVLQHASMVTGVPLPDIERAMQKKMAEIEEIKKYSPILYETIAHNAAENAVFDLVSSVRSNVMDPHPSLLKFDEITFLKLARMVQAEHPMFRPLKQPADPIRRVWKVTPILVPSNLREYKKYNGVNTACATAQGDFVFNKPFMQNLMDWAVIEGVHPQGKKYHSNGGPIPDAYVYVEFLIMHEYMHFAYGDFNYSKQLPQFNHKVHNWASDFRSNYDLVKNNFAQLPIGLFSDHINSDRQGSYTDMAQLVHDELKKLPPHLQKLWEKIAKIDEEPNKPKTPKKTSTKPPPPVIKVRYRASESDVVRLPDGTYGQVTKVDPDGSFDTRPLTQDEATQLLNYPKGYRVRANPQITESKRKRILLEGRWKPDDVIWMKPKRDKPTPPPQPPEPPLPPEPEDDEDEPTPPPVIDMEGEDPPPDEDDEEEGSSGGEEGEDEEEDGKEGKGKDEKEKEKKKEKVFGPSPDEIAEKLKDQINDSNITPRPGTPSGRDDPRMGPGQAGSPGGAGALPLGSAKKRVEDIKPHMNWKQLIKLMVSSSQLATDTSYTKPSRRNITGAPIAAKLGAAAIKPGQVKRPVPINKVLLAFDTSGSMWGFVPTALKEAEMLLKQLGKVDYPFGVMFWAGSHESFVVNQGQDFYAPVDNLRQLNEPVDKSKQIKGWNNVLKQHGTGGTMFTPAMVSELSAAASDGFNILIFSDTDLLINQNWLNFLKLWKAHKANVFCVFNDEPSWRNAVKKVGQNTPHFTHL